MTSKPVNYLIFLKKWVGFIQNSPQIMWINGVFDHGQGTLPHPQIPSQKRRKLRPETKSGMRGALRSLYNTFDDALVYQKKYKGVSFSMPYRCLASANLYQVSK